MLQATYLSKISTAQKEELVDCALTCEANKRLLETYEGFVRRYNTEVGELLRLLEARVEPEGFKQLRRACTSQPCIFDAGDLQRVAAYADFVSEVLMQHQPLPLEVRIEGWKAYCLIPPEFSLLGSVVGRPLLWVHDEDWAVARFRDGGKDLGLCGQVMGRSKFVTPCEMMPTSKSAALDALGLQGYAAFDKPGTLYVLCAKLSPALLVHANPLVPLLYKVGSATDQTGTSPESWATELHFQEGAMPGFTWLLICDMRFNSMPSARFRKSGCGLNRWQIRLVLARVRGSRTTCWSRYHLLVTAHNAAHTVPIVARGRHGAGIVPIAREGQLAKQTQLST